MTTQTKNKINKEKKCKFLKDKNIIKLLKDPDLREYLLLIIADALKEDIGVIDKDFILKDERIGTSTETKNTTADIVADSSYAEYNLEVNFNGPSTEINNKNMIYVCNLLVKQTKPHTGYKYRDVKKVIQININYFDQFKKGEFKYTSSIMEERLHIIRTDILKIIDFNLSFLHQIDYNDLKNFDKRAAEKLIFILTCEDRGIWKEMYGDDELMKKVEEKLEVIDYNQDAYDYYDEEEFRKNCIFSQGLDEGRSEARLETAKAFLKNGVDKDFVINTMKLTKEEIEALKIYD